MLLIVDPKPRRGESYADSFYWMGVLCNCYKPIEALSHISPAIGALLIVEPCELSDYREYVSRVRALCRTVPIFALCEKLIDAPDIFEQVFGTSGYTASYLSRMREAGVHLGARPVGLYRLGGMDASCTEDAVRYKGQSIPVTKTEAMILRYLFLSYPARTDAHDILTHAYRRDKRPERATVRAHVCSLNRKLACVLGRRAIDNVRDEGYRIVLPSESGEV